MTDRRRTAVHEAGHAVANVVLGGTVEYVSIRPGRTFSGINVPVRTGRPDVDRFNPFLPVTVQPSALRGDIERDIICALAGDIATLYLATPTIGYCDEPDTDAIARRALESLGPRLAEMVVAREESEEASDGDEANAWQLADAFAGPEVGMFYLEWLRASARALVLRYSAAILRVADALERHAVFMGEQVAALVYPRKTGAKHMAATRILAPIPAERRRVALRNYHDRAGRIVHEGSVWDANDEFVNEQSGHVRSSERGGLTWRGRRSGP